MTLWKLFLLGAAVLLQLAWPHGGGAYFIVPNFFLITLILLSINTDVRPLLWSSLAGGLAFDLTAARDFGFHMAFFILIVLVTKLILRLQMENLHIMSLLFVITVATIAYNVLLIAPIFQASHLIQLRVFASRLGYEVLYNGCIVSVAGVVMRLRHRGIIGA